MYHVMYGCHPHYGCQRTMMERRYGMTSMPVPVYPAPVSWPANYREQNLKDNGRNPYVVNIEKVTKQNENFRTALWTGAHLQLTLMSIAPGEDIGLEIHPDVDQFLRIEQGEGLVQMGRRKEALDFERRVFDDDAIIIPAGTWHNVTNTGNTPMKLYSIYAPPNHPFGTVHPTKADAIEAEEGYEQSRMWNSRRVGNVYSNQLYY